MTWVALENDPTREPGLLSTRVEATSAIPLYLAVDKPSNTRAIVLEVQAKTIPRGLKLPSCSGFMTEIRPLAPNVGADVRIVLRLGDREGKNVFTVLAKDVASHVLAAPDKKGAVTALSSRLVAWHNFFRKSGVKGLDRESQQGLFAELWFIRQHLMRILPPGAIVDGWTGVSRRNQDFQFAGATIEIKSSAANPPVRLYVTNVKQLEQSSSAPLFLYVLLVDCREGAGESLAQAVVATRELLTNSDPSAAALFDDRLIECGYTETSETPYDSPKFTVQREYLFRVTGDFPRLVTADLMAGVGEVSYTIDLSSCLSYSVSFGVLSQALTGERNGA